MAAELKEKNLKARLLLQVHDELIFEAPKEEIEILEKLVPEVMEHALAWSDASEGGLCFRAVLVRCKINREKEVMIVPELPEVETVRRTLTGLVKGKTIESAHIRWPNIIKNPPSRRNSRGRLQEKRSDPSEEEESFAFPSGSLCHGVPPSDGGEIRSSSGR